VGHIGWNRAVDQLRTGVVCVWGEVEVRRAFAELWTLFLLANVARKRADNVKLLLTLGQPLMWIHFF
jgi:hypothetical protein